MHSYQPQLRQPRGAQITAALLPPPIPPARVLPGSVLNHLINLTWGLPSYEKKNPTGLHIERKALYHSIGFC